MKEFQYKIKDKDGIHARPAGILVKEAAKYECKITISKAGKEVDAKRIIGIMGLGAKQGDEVTVKCDGGDENTAYDVLNKFFKENL